MAIDGPGGRFYYQPSTPKPKAKTSTSSRRSAPSRVPSRSASPQRSKSSGSSGRSSSGRSSGNSSRSSSGNSGRSSAPKAPAAPKAPSLASYLGTDSVYQGAVRGGKRSLNDFLSEMGRRKGEAGTQFNQTKGSMERDRTTQLDGLRDEFASRGLIQSGLYGQEQGNFQQKFTEQMTALQQQQSGLLADLLGQEKNYRRENDLATEAARQEALLRRSQKFKIGA